MSTNTFELGYVFFQAFLKQTGGMISPHSHLSKCCSLADIQFPKNSDEASEFSQKCIFAMKKKASVLASICPDKFKHTERLNLVANMCFFPHWKGFLEFADSFPKLSDSQRKTSGDSMKLCSCLWKLPTNHFDEYALGYMATSGLILSHKSKIPLDEATTIARRIFSDDLARTSGDFISQNEVFQLIHTLHEDPVAHYLTFILSLTPSNNGIQASWPNPAIMTVGGLIAFDVVYENPIENVPISVKEMLIMCVMSDIHLYAEQDISLTSPERRKILSSLVKDRSRLEVDKAIDKILSAHTSTSVIDAISGG